MNKTIKETLLAGVFSTIIMDIGFVFLKVSNIATGSMEPPFLGRWLLNVFHGELFQENIRIATQFRQSFE